MTKNKPGWLQRLFGDRAQKDSAPPKRPPRRAPRPSDGTPAPPTHIQATTRISPAPAIPRPAQPPAPLAPQTPPAHRYQPGEVIAGLYEVEAHLGTGGMGTVWKVRHRQWGIPVVMKEIRADKVADTLYRQAFNREAQNWINLPMHPNIVTAYYVREIDGELRIFSEFVEGENLAERLRRRGPLREEEALDIALQVCEALAHAHRHGMAHRDIKPSNILLGWNGVVKVTDFGLAKGLEAGRAAAATVAGHWGGSRSGFTTPGGTAEYMSPEQTRKWVDQKVEVSFPSDLWSLGIVLYEMVTGERPEQGGIAIDWLRSQLRKALGVPQPSRRYLKLVWQCLRKEPSKRAWLVGPPTTGWIRWAPRAPFDDAMRRAYRRIARRPYPRAQPESLEMGAADLNNRALSHLDLGQPQRAVEMWEEALRQDPSHWETLWNLFVYSRRHGMTFQRSDELARAQPRESEGSLRVGTYRLSLFTGRVSFDEGIRNQLENGVKEQEWRAWAWNALGAARYYSGYLQEAQEAFRRAAELDGRAWWARWNLAAALWWPGQREEALELAEELGKQRPAWAKDRPVEDCLSLMQGKPFQWACLQVMEGHTELVWSVAISSDGRWGLSGSGDKTLRLWDLQTGACLRVMEGHTGGVWSVAISSDGSQGLSGSGDKTLRLWDLQSGQRLRVMEGHTGEVWSVAISSDGRWGLSGSDDKTLRLWDLQTGACLQVMEGHTLGVVSVAISSDGRWGLSGSDDKTLRLWDLQSGQCQQVMQGHTDPVESVAIRLDRRWGLSGSDDKTLRLWGLRWLHEQLLEVPLPEDYVLSRPSLRP